MRGVAALAVVLFHERGLLGGPNAFAHGYLAVDFFFLLSGFIISYAYGERLRGGWALRSFLRVRVIRLYPLYLLGLMLGALPIVLADLSGKAPLPAKDLLLSLATSLLMMPSAFLAIAGHRLIYTFNPAMWSLFFELAANVLHAWLLRGRGLKLPVTLVVLSAAALMASVVRMGRLDFGIEAPVLLYGIPRILFSYTLGVLLFRLRSSAKMRIVMDRLRLPSSVVLLLLALILAAPAMSRGVTIGFDLTAALLVFPLLLLAGASTQPVLRWKAPFRLLGLLSFAIYVLHLPLTTYLLEFWRKVGHRDAYHDGPWSGLIFLVLLLAAAYVADIAYDLPLRNRLRRLSADLRPG